MSRASINGAGTGARQRTAAQRAETMNNCSSGPSPGRGQLSARQRTSTQAAEEINNCSSAPSPGRGQLSARQRTATQGAETMNKCSSGPSPSRGHLNVRSRSCSRASPSPVTRAGVGAAAGRSPARPGGGGGGDGYPRVRASAARQSPWRAPGMRTSEASTRAPTSPTDNNMKDLASWYEGRTVLVTGGAGFMGKVLLEKMLRALPGLRRVYLLLRAKRGAAPARRVQDMCNLPVFDKLRAERPEVLQKLVAVEGDILSEGLGLSEAERERLLGEVSVVFHGAASLRLEAELKSAVQHNTAGTLRVLQLCRDMPKLEAFVHLSTAFCHCEELELEERVYPPLKNPQEVMRVVEFLDDESLRAITPELLGQHPNCYTFSKRLAETLVDEEKDKLPVVIVRPSIVSPSFKEPLPGWVDSLNGPIGLTVGAGKGVIRSMLCGTDYFAEVIPVDIVTNFMLIAAWDRAVNKKNAKETPVFNVSNGDVVKVTWEEIVDRGRMLTHQYPFDYVVWYPDGNIRSSHLVHNLIVFFFQTIPAYIIDFLLLLFLQKTFMVRLQKRISVGMEVLQYFTMRQWVFHISKFKGAMDNLVPKDKEIFYCTNIEFDMDNYLINVLLGARQYCMKEPLSTLPRARRHLKLMFVVHQLTKIGFYAFMIYLLISYIEPLRFTLDYILSNLGRTPGFRNFITSNS